MDDEGPPGELIGRARPGPAQVIFDTELVIRELALTAPAYFAYSALHPAVTHRDCGVRYGKAGLPVFAMP